MDLTAFRKWDRFLNEINANRVVWLILAICCGCLMATNAIQSIPSILKNVQSFLSQKNCFGDIQLSYAPGASQISTIDGAQDEQDRECSTDYSRFKG